MLACTYADRYHWDSITDARRATNVGQYEFGKVFVLFSSSFLAYTEIRIKKLRGIRNFSQTVSLYIDRCH